MPVDAVQLARYQEKAPELLETVDLTQGIMKKEPTARFCAQLCEGLCAIQNTYGSDFLGDSCHFYPRIVHRIGGRQLMVGSTSCPEMLRLMLEESAPFVREEVTLARMPGIRRDILPEGVAAEQALAVMDEFMAIAANDAHSPEDVMMQIIDTMCEGMDQGVAKPGNAYGIYYALALTEAFASAPRRPRLDAVMQGMEAQLGCRFARAERSVSFTPDAANRLAQLTARWHGVKDALAPMLRRWIQAQLAMTAFPFGGLSGLTAFEHTAVLVQRFATMRLALMCHVAEDGTPPDVATAMRVIQVLSRFMDHLADAKLTQMIFRDMGWSSPNQLKELIRL